MSSDDDRPASGWDMVMPFVVVASQGGPYDDVPFCAGFELGRLDSYLAACAAMDPPALPGRRLVRTASVPQIDLIAMRHGCTVAADPCDETPEWSQVTFERADDPA